MDYRVGRGRAAAEALRRRRPDDLGLRPSFRGNGVWWLVSVFVYPVGESWSDWAGGMTVTVECEADGPPISTLAGTMDQAALHGLLRRLYSLGSPLISVVWVRRASDEIVRNCLRMMFPVALFEPLLGFYVAIFGVKKGVS